MQSAYILYGDQVDTIFLSIFNFWHFQPKGGREQVGGGRYNDAVAHALLLAPHRKPSHTGILFFCISISTTENWCWYWAHEGQDADDLDSRVVGFCSHEWRVSGESKMMIIQGDQDRRSGYLWCLFQVTPGGNVRLWRRVGSSKPAHHQKWVPAQSLLLINIEKQPQNISRDLLHAVPWCSAAESQSAIY